MLENLRRRVASTVLGIPVETLAWDIRTLVPPWANMSSAGVAVDRQTVVGLPAVYACHRLLTSTVSRMPLDVLQKRDNGVPVPYSRPPRWLTRPIVGNPNHDFVIHLVQVMSSLLFEGNFFTLIPRDDSNDVSEMFVLDPREIEITGTVAAPGYKVTVGRSNRPEFGPEEVIHRPLLVFPGSQRGVSPIEALRQAFGTGLAAQQYGASYFENSARPDGGYIAVPQGSKVTVKELKDSWDADHAGARNAFKTGVLTGGAEWKPLGFTNEQSQFIETRRLSMTEAAMVYGVPPHMIGDTERSTSWGTGIEVQGIGFVTYSLNDYLVLLETAYARAVPRGDTFLRFKRNALMRGDSKARGEFYREMFGVGAYSPNRILALEDEPPFEGGDEHYYPSANFTPIGQEPANPPNEPPTEPEAEGD